MAAGTSDGTDWLTEARAAYSNASDEADPVEMAKAAALIDIAESLREVGGAVNENLDGIGNALGDLITTINRRTA